MVIFAPGQITQILLWLCLLVCCGGGSGRMTFAVIPKGTTHEFWQAVHAGARQGAEEEGVDIIWRGPIREDDREGQVTVVENFIARRVDGIILAPLDETALAYQVEQAARRKIPVVIIDSALKGGGYVSFIATDNRKGGELAARHLGKLLKGAGKVLLLRYQVGSASTTKREEGFLEALRRGFPGLRVVSENQHAGATAASAYAVAEGLLARFVDLDGIFCPNESSTIGMLRALQDAGRAGKVRFVGFDSSPKLIEALEKGELDGLVLQAPFAMGRLGVRVMHAHLRGKPVEARIDTGVRLATPANLHDPEISALLSPDLSKVR